MNLNRIYVKEQFLCTIERRWLFTHMRKMVVLSNDHHDEQDIILTEERRCSSLPSSPAKRVSSSRKKQFYISKANRNSELTPRAKGKKRLQRLENALHLANLLEKEECCVEELEVCSLPSIFTEACTNGNYAELWDDFMNRSGEEQERLLALLEEEAKKKNGGGGGGSKLLKDQMNVGRVVPPPCGFTCFLRIDRRLRFSLRRKQIPMGTLEGLEEGVLNFFNAQPQAVYTANLGSSFERLLLHALCQYMDLVSASSDCNGARQTEVVNKQEGFQPPTPLLSVYLESMS